MWYNGLVYLEKLVQYTILPILTGKVHLQKVIHWTNVPGKIWSKLENNMVQWTSVPRKTGTIDNCSHTNAPAKSGRLQ